MKKRIIENAQKQLENAHVSDALNIIAEGAEVSGMFDISEKARKLQRDYSLMLNYFSTGINDPARPDMLARIYDETYFLIDLLQVSLEKERPERRIEDYLLVETNGLFYAIENNFPATKDDRNYIQQLILNEEHPLYLRGMVLSALTLNLLKYFDNEKFESLYTYTLEDQPLAIQARAWVAIVLVVMAHDIRISTQPRLVEQLKFFCEEGRKLSPAAYGRKDGETDVMLLIQVALLQSQRGKNVRKIFRGQIASDIRKGLNEIQHKKVEDEEDVAPLWEEFMEKTKLQEKIRDFIGLQQDGVDIMYDSFVQMKKNMGWYGDKANWFMPFDPAHPYVKPLFDGGGPRANYAKIIEKAGNMCSTDKYSNLMLTACIPAPQFEQVESAMTAGNVNADNVLGATLEDEVMGYVHDLYRFYTLYKDENSANKDGDSAYNPFSHKLFFNCYIGLQDVATTEADLQMLAKFLIEGENWEEAVRVLSLLVEMNESEMNMQRLAYCYNKRDNDHVESLTVLSRCNYLYPTNKWTMKNYAKSLDAVGDFSAEENLLREGCKSFPDDTSFVVSLAQCLMNQGCYEEALEQLFKADMMKENSYRTCSNLAFCAFALANGKMAEKYITLTLGMQKADNMDWIHGGHIALLNNDVVLAIERYCNASSDDLEYCFSAELDVLLDVGIPLDTITLAFEVAKQKLQG